LMWPSVGCSAVFVSVLFCGQREASLAEEKAAALGSGIASLGL
jgi:hypothetical protein